MKTNSNYTILFSIILLFLFSCSKEKNYNQLSNPEPSDEQLVSQVNWFLNGAQQVKEGKFLKSDEKMYIDSALYFIESALNYKYGYTNEKFKEYSVSEISVTIPYLSAENKTYVINAMDAYNNTLQKFREIYQLLNLDNKKFYMCSLKNGGVTADGNSVIINAKVYFGYGRRILSPSSNEVGYYWFLDGGDCELMGQYGAPNYLIDNYIPAIYLPCPNPRIWFNETDNFEFDQDISNYPNPDGGPIDNYCDYQLYYAISNVAQGITEDVKCVGSESINGAIPEIEYYHNQLQVLINTKLLSVDKQFMDVTFKTPDVTVGTIRTIRHIPNIYFGKIHFDCSATPGIPLPIMD